MYYRPSYHTALTRAALALIVSLVVVSGAVAQDPDPVAIFNQGQDAHEKGDLAGAVKLYEQALKLLPEFPEAEYQRGSALLSLGKLDDAEAAFRRAVSLRSDWSLAYAKLGEVLVTKHLNSGQGQFQGSEDARRIYTEASDVLNKALELDPNNYPAWVALVELRIASTTAANTLRESLDKTKTFTDGKMNPPASLWAVRGALEYRLGDVPSAKRSLQSALDVDPKNKTALLQLADIAVAEKDAVKAHQLADRLKAITNDTDALRLLNARIFALEGKLDDALKQLDAIARPNANAAELRTQIGAARSTDPAELEKLLANDPKNASLLGRLCVLYRRGDPAKAREYCRKALDEESNNVDHAVGFAAALVQDKEFEGAVNVLRKILTVAPQNATAHANLATALFELKRYPEAKVEFRWLIDAQPKSAAPYYFLGIVHDQLGEYMDAMANYQIYLKLADPVQNKLDIEKVNLRLPILQRSIKDGKGKKNSD